MDLETHSGMDYVADQFIGMTGSVSPLYASGTALARAGIVFGLDMTTEGSSRSFLFFPPTASFFTSHCLHHKTPSLALFCPLILEITPRCLIPDSPIVIAIAPSLVSQYLP